MVKADGGPVVEPAYDTAAATLPMPAPDAAGTWLPPLLRRDARRPLLLRAATELLAFAWHEALSCLFAVFIFAMLGATHYFAVPGLPRYDLLLLLCLGMQAWMIAARIESRDELKVICVFHLLGLALELWKVHYGSWSYPGEAWTKVGGVPLFGGFMYAAVASYICQAWRRLQLVFTGWPARPLCVALALGIYGNFFANHFLPDQRLLLFLAVAVVFRRARVTFVCNGPRRWMPVTSGFLLVGLFIWFAENISTFLGAWRYPNQHHGWAPVYFQKLTSWWLLVIVSAVIIAELKREKRRRDAAHDLLTAGAGAAHHDESTV